MNNLIKFTVLENGDKRTLETYRNEYKNLMFLLKDRLFLDSFGECGGVGRCATCVVKTSGVNGDSAVKERNEPETLSKIGYTDEFTRLSCQLFITKDLENAEIEILDV
ncbi:MAG: ferredoxin [Bacteroidetes bacterium HGW-Bacteroidetes-23]|nr:MAG: ferredoxin [Bacteroidetes bacterium HGW-Bacteroidetes-23]